MKASVPIKIEFHKQAAERFTELAQSVLTQVGTFGSVQPPGRNVTELHPVANFRENDVIGPISWSPRSVNGFGQETGRYWESGGTRVGWECEGYEAVKRLASSLENSSPLKGRVSSRFVMDEVFAWLRGTLETGRTDTLPEFIAARCSEEIRHQEIWVPIYRTYSAGNFSIGTVQFRTISQAMLDRWYARIPEDELQRAPGAAIALNRQRSALQGTLAACVRVEAEPRKASETAHSAADEAVALLRVLSPVNWTCRLTSHCLPIRKENTHMTMDLTVEDESIRSIGRGTIEVGPAAWNVDGAREGQLTAGVLEALHNLALQRTNSEFCADLYGALQLHARHSIATEVAHKLVFVVAAAESFFLRNTSEPIQKNLGERMAFLIGKTIEERRKVIRNADGFYGLRSRLIHHGRDVQENQKDVVDEFFFNVWFAFILLLRSANQWRTREEMFTELENKKLA